MRARANNNRGHIRGEPEHGLEQISCGISRQRVLTGPSMSRRPGHRHSVREVERLQDRGAERRRCPEPALVEVRAGRHAAADADREVPRLGQAGLTVARGLDVQAHEVI